MTTVALAGTTGLVVRIPHAPSHPPNTLLLALSPTTPNTSNPPPRAPTSSPPSSPTPPSPPSTPTPAAPLPTPPPPPNSTPSPPPTPPPGPPTSPPPPTLHLHQLPRHHPLRRGFPPRPTRHRPRPQLRPRTGRVRRGRLDVRPYLDERGERQFHDGVPADEGRIGGEG
ncbi:hypothetical protein GRF29_19g598147 [Pseudopithomyces chartarum]|uniref:Uncharacterized protein n=1 Tax=Pseudopithomyces chartarum TaxID=1892770 RepID=A0AAN6M1D3_9PLEO|nr:hypothetical protein GRF29_19g598147 [Pseudopithomyces chartarum]